MTWYPMTVSRVLLAVGRVSDIHENAPIGAAVASTLEWISGVRPRVYVSACRRGSFMEP